MALPPFNNDNTFRGIGSNLVVVQNELKNAFDQCGYSNTDLRGLFFLNTRTLVQFNIALMNIFSVAQENRMRPEVYRQLLGIAKGNLNDATQHMNLYMRASLITLYQFQVENLFANILARMKSDIPRGYLRIVGMLLDRITTTRKEDKTNILKVLQYGRNSLHSNATHNNENFSYKLGSTEYRFTKGQSVTCMSWFSIPPIMVATINVIKDVVASPEVRSIPEPIVIQYIEF